MLKYLFFVFTIMGVCANEFAYDLSIVGPIKYADGLGRISIGLIDTLHKDLRINYVWQSRKLNLTDVSKIVRKVAQNKDKSGGAVSILTVPPVTSTWDPYTQVPKQSLIKIAYSTFESTEIPDRWVPIFNKRFDLVVVTDPFLKPIYQKSGVKIPIFILPHGMYLESFLKEKPKKEGVVPKPFVFGCSALACPRKNLDRLIEAFQAEFGDNPNVRLKIQSRHYCNDEIYLQAVKTSIRTDNVEFILEELNNKKHKEFLKSLDCYVLLSKGEGLSVTPREALALGIPCLLSNNTAHTTICNTNLVLCVDSKIKEPAIYGPKAIGFDFNSRLEDIQYGLRKIYSDYPIYKAKALEARKWTQRYLWVNLKTKFLNLINPKKILLGPKNVVTDDALVTNSVTLFKKYKKLNL